MSVIGLGSFPFAWETQSSSDLGFCYIDKISHALMEGTAGFSAYGGLDGNQKVNSVYIECAMVIQC